MVEDKPIKLSLGDNGVKRTVFPVVPANKQGEGLMDMDFYYDYEDSVEINDELCLKKQKALCSAAGKNSPGGTSPLCG